MSVEIDASGLDRLVESWDRLVKQFPEEKRKMLERLGPRMLELIRQNIGGGGTVAGWQEMYMGSRGGYVAVRPRAKQYKRTKGGKEYAVGYVTNAIERGHRHGGRRVPDHKGYKYRGRITTPAVPGRWFYAAARRELPNMAESEIRRLLDLIVDGLEGRM